MGPRNLLILFFSTVAVSLVVLIIFFSLFFKNMNLNFNARMPESAPILGREYANEPPMRQDSKAEGFTRASVNVPPDTQEPPISRAAGGRNAGKGHESELEPPPISDDALLKGDNSTAPPETTPEEKAPSEDTPSDSASGALPLPETHPERNATSPAASAPSRTSRTPSSGGKAHHTPTVPEGNSAPPAKPAPAPAPQPPAETPSGPPVPGGNG